MVLQNIDLDEMKETGEIIKVILRMVFALPTDDLKLLLDEQRTQRRKWENVGHIVDPTEYRNYLTDDGAIADTIEGIIERLIEIRALTIQHEELVAKKRGRSWIHGD